METRPPRQSLTSTLDRSAGAGQTSAPQPANPSRTIPELPESFSVREIAHRSERAFGINALKRFQGKVDPARKSVPGSNYGLSFSTIADTARMPAKGVTSRR